MSPPELSFTPPHPPAYSQVTHSEWQHHPQSCLEKHWVLFMTMLFLIPVSDQSPSLATVQPRQPLQLGAPSCLKIFSQLISILPASHLAPYSPFSMYCKNALAFISPNLCLQLSRSLCLSVSPWVEYPCCCESPPLMRAFTLLPARLPKDLASLIIPSLC